ncbi:hypothetical protein FOQG_17198 [Fusarium oxysporum f. sp. raphani 54005]|uniref:Uncharacterized protein n=2 Tax=Fusarium oxysporum f. sp. raphani TaxID=96318 RepID=X0B7H3_FUSOX|nr:hypothetical protein FOQG_17198 [Fusarium oxysporum f. sp. raphani 54005]KAG7405701.1 hypothetical protein Forpi1262_v018430 [Fusarium oxysporum f. sp. raphani]
MDPAVTVQLNDQDVYQATKDIFVGQKARFRKVRPVRKSIESCSRRDDTVRQFVALYGAEAICQIVLRLLSGGVYESPLTASRRFPDLFNPSVVQSAARDILEAEAIRSEQTALEGIVQSQLTDSQETFNWTEIMVALRDSGNNVPNGQTSNSSSLFPVYLPFPTEHLLMERLQKTLELACYEFGARAMPDTLRNRGWDCPESVELSKWTEVLKREGVLKRENTRKTLKELLYSIANIRHTAVHRLRTSSVGLEMFIADAEDLVEVLGDTAYSKSISQLRTNMNSAITELTQNKQFLQLQLEQTRAAIERQRAELDRREQEAIDYAREEDRKYQILAGEKVQQALEVIGNFEVTTNISISPPECFDGIEDMGDDDDDDMDQFEDCDE